jgi:CHASE2 domain-containing sensor protein
MSFNWDNVTGVNLILCIAIVVIGYLAWQRTTSTLILLVAGAFALFGLSHLAALLSLNDDLENPLIAVRVAAYLMVTLALIVEARRKKPTPTE